MSEENGEKVAENPQERDGEEGKLLFEGGQIDLLSVWLSVFMFLWKDQVLS